MEAFFYKIIQTNQKKTAENNVYPPRPFNKLLVINTF